MIFRKARGNHRRFSLWKRFHRYESDLQRRLTNLDGIVQLEIYELLKERSAKAVGDDRKTEWRLMYLEEDASGVVNRSPLCSRLPNPNETEYRVILCGRGLNRGASDGLM